MSDFVRPTLMWLEAKGKANLTTLVNQYSLNQNIGEHDSCQLGGEEWSSAACHGVPDCLLHRAQQASSCHAALKGPFQTVHCFEACGPFCCLLLLQCA